MKIPNRKTKKKLLKGSIATAMLSEKALAEDWESKEDEEAWKNF